MSGEENLGNLRVYIHELDRKMICPCEVSIVCEEHRTLNGLFSVSATVRVKICHVSPDVMQDVYDKCKRVVTCTIGERQTAHFYAGDFDSTHGGSLIQADGEMKVVVGEEDRQCCDFCTHAKHGTVVIDGKRVTAGPEGCKLHKDKEHQDIAATCGYCDDFCCFQSLVSVDREMQEGDGE